jgi:signal transduction histidine kinase
LPDLPVGLVELDEARRVSVCSPEAARLLRIDRAGILGRPIDEVASALPAAFWRLREALHQWSAQPDNPNQRSSFDVEIADPELRTLSVDIFPIDDVVGKTNGSGFIVRDVTRTARRAARREREKIAMDLHDGIVQSLYALVLGLGARERSAPAQDDPALRQALGQTTEQVRTIVGEVRALLLRLRDGDQDTPRLRAQLRSLASELEGHGLVRLQLHVDDSIEELFGVDATANLVQIVREATSNAIRHAAASSVTISCGWLGDSRALVTIADDGEGFDRSRARKPPSMGMRNMAVRAHALGGSLTIASEPGRGTVVRLEIPVSSNLVAV